MTPERRAAESFIAAADAEIYQSAIWKLQHSTAPRLNEAEGKALLTALKAAERREKALREVLKQTQWGNCNLIYGKIYHMCPRCDQVEKNGHSPDCPIGLALADTEEPK